jgi:hypothetical protein
MNVYTCKNKSYSHLLIHELLYQYFHHHVVDCDNQYSYYHIFVKKIIVISYYRYIVLFPNHFAEITEQIYLFWHNFNSSEKNCPCRQYTLVIKVRHIDNYDIFFLFTSHVYNRILSDSFGNASLHFVFSNAQALI